MTNGCPSLLMLLPHHLLRRKRACLAQTLEVAGHLETGIQTPAVALMNVLVTVTLTDVDLALGEVTNSQGITAKGRGPVLDTIRVPRGIHTVETLHPGGETTADDYILTYFQTRSIFSLLAFGRKTFK